MSKHSQKQRIELSKTEQQIGSSGGQVGEVQSMLARYGYLRGSYRPGDFCQATDRAVKRYQRFFQLKPDGLIGPITRAALERPRCGVPDLYYFDASSHSSPYVLVGCSYGKRRLTYTFQNHSSDLGAGRAESIVGAAFTAWEAVANLQFVQIQPSEPADFVVGWTSGDHGDGDPFDDHGGPSSNVLAHAFFPPPCGGAYAGTMHFDEAEYWVESAFESGIVLYQVALHEIGHLLGLKHSQVPSSIMYPAYSADNLSLHADDIAGVQSLYGAEQGSTPLSLEAAASDRLSGPSSASYYSIEVPRTLTIQIAGPADADFDIYVKRDGRPTVEDWDFRAWTVSSSEKQTIPIDGDASRYEVMVISYEGAGDFDISVEAGP